MDWEVNWPLTFVVVLCCGHVWRVDNVLKQMAEIRDHDRRLRMLETEVSVTLLYLPSGNQTHVPEVSVLLNGRDGLVGVYVSVHARVLVSV